MPNKRILHISKYYPPYAGGIEYVCYEVVSHLKDFEHSVICFNDRNETVIENYEGVRVVRVGTFAVIASQALSFSYWHLLKSEIHRFRPDIIHFHAPNPLVSLYLLSLIPHGTKLVVHYHAEILSSAFLYTCYRPWEKRLFRRADAILVTSPNLMNEAEPIQAYRDKCHVVENTITTGELDLTASEEQGVERLHERYGHRKIVLSFGRHVPYKGLDLLIEAEKYIRSKCEIIIGGTGPQTEQLKRLARSPRIHFVGRIPDDELKYYLHAADVFAFPSVTRAEAFGVALAQAMYCRVPPVTFTIPASGVNYVNLNGVTGIEVPNGNAAAFGAAVDRLLSDGALRKSLGEAGRQRIAENFTMDIVSRKLAGLYRKL